jgi:hypothetical protein
MLNKKVNTRLRQQYGFIRASAIAYDYFEIVLLFEIIGKLIQCPEDVLLFLKRRNDDAKSRIFYRQGKLKKIMDPIN